MRPYGTIDFWTMSIRNKRQRIWAKCNFVNDENNNLSSYVVGTNVVVQKEKAPKRLNEMQNCERQNNNLSSNFIGTNVSVENEKEPKRLNEMKITFERRR